jgi:hypothetical protein
VSLNIRLDIFDGIGDLAIEDIAKHPSVPDVPGVFAIYETLHALFYVCVCQRPSPARDKRIQPLRLQAEIDEAWS